MNELNQEAAFLRHEISELHKHIQQKDEVIARLVDRLSARLDKEAETAYSGWQEHKEAMEREAEAFHRGWRIFADRIARNK